MVARMVLTMICKDEKQQKQTMRAVKTLFFLLSMLISFLIFSAPVLLAVVDSLLPSAFLCAISVFSNYDHALVSSYDFTLSIVDVPVISLVRSAIIVFVYSLCDGPRLSRGPYLGMTTICSLFSLVFISVKASYFFNPAAGLFGRTMEVALFVCSAAMAVGHIVVAYRVSSRERRKLLVYKIDIEAVVSKNGFPSRYSKLLQLERMK